MSGRVAILVAALAVAASCSSGRSLDATRADVSAPGIHQLAGFPLTQRSASAFVWTGDRLFVWGGVTADDPSTDRRSLGDGAVLTPGRGWRELPPTTFPHGLYGSLGAWDGTEVVVIGSACDETIPPDTTGDPPRCTEPAAIAWNPDTDAWRRLPPPPIPLDPSSGAAVLRWRGVALGGPGVALFVDQGTGTALQWDRARGTWSSAAGPSGEAVVACSDPTRPWIVATVAAYGSPSSGRALWTLRPTPDGPPVWSEMPSPAASVDASTCGAGRVLGSEGLQPTLVDVSSGASTPLRAQPTTTPSDGLRVTSASLVGWWVFESSYSGRPAIPTTTSVPLEQADRGPVTTLAPPVVSEAPEAAREATPTWSVRALPDGEPLDFDGERFNLVVWAGTTVTTDDGVISCDLRDRRSCMSWTAPPGARPRR